MSFPSARGRPVNLPYRQWAEKTRRGVTFPSLSLRRDALDIPNLSEKLFPRVDLRRSFHPLCGLPSITPITPRPCSVFANNHFHWVGDRAKNRTHLGDVLHDIQQVYGIRIKRNPSATRSLIAFTAGSSFA